MKPLTPLVAACLFAAFALAADQPAGPVVIDFEKAEVGKAPEGFTLATTGPGKPGEWVVQEDATAPPGKKVLVQTSDDNTSLRFPLCVYDAVSAKDVEVTVRFKAVAGGTDQAAGVVARFKDKDNYYVVRANALEDNVRLYKVEAGQRVQFAGVKAAVPGNQWHSLKLTVKGGHFVVQMNDKQLFEADDTTFKDAGKAGLWTKADSVTRFDDLRIEVKE